VLGSLRRVITPQRDLAQRAIDDINDLPGLDVGTRDYFRDVYDHLIRLSDTVDGYRDLLTGLMDVYLSTTSNRMNAVMKQLTVVATVFLPVTALTGFFGMNFGWLVSHVDTFWSFMVFGVGGVIFAAVVLLTWFKRARFFE
jgi:magnesium transporter